MNIKTKRIYEAPSTADGYRVLVDRLWPRGLKKEDAQIALWLKAVAPSNELRKWFHHEESNWPMFVLRYRAELQNNEALQELKELAEAHQTITLLYGAKDEAHNQAIVLKQLLEGTT
ncbi:DUF488 domain-containing protein [Pedobacter sp. KR3-3]|uniref:DUF488 domain-containing protein n=1 Tax=Pedobacter albus TaxID=3113905 RepID=A0ABU7I6A1_9SPHI|nr:DUF488 domain-containing protein [Pedobacter sp. KR3-3]MEE1944887.1 DUF488 domain-containing protein [Pedobacter sp. KR3-3]